MTKQFEAYPDSGSLFKSLTKATAKAPDYFGEIAVDLKKTEGIRVDENGLTIIKISGWSKEAASGKKYVSLSVNRFVPEASGGRSAPRRQQQQDDDEF
jgi:hypothetical protein